jgi:hypothetical protein
MWSIAHNLGGHLRQHWVAYALALAVGIVVIAPYAYFAFTPEYRGVALMGHDAEEHYLARMQEVYDGFPRVGNTFTQFKEAPYLSPALGEQLVAYAGIALGLSVTQINLLAKLPLPLVIWLLVYAFCYTLSGSRLHALLGAAGGMLAIAFMSPGSEVLGTVWGRPINPQVSGIILFGVLWALYRLHSGHRHLWLFGIVAAGTGAALYISPYVWSFLGACIVGLVIWAMVQKEFRRAMEYCATGLAALMCAVPFILNYIAAQTHPGHESALLAQEVLASHAPAIGVWVVALVLLLFAGKRLLNATSWSFLLVCALSLIAVLNQQVLTGLHIQPGHYHWYITKPLAGIVLALVCCGLLTRYFRSRETLIVSVALLALFAGTAYAQVRFYQRHAPQALAAQTYAPLFSYLQSLPRQSIFANSTLSLYLPIYTHHDAPGNPYIKFYHLPSGYLDTMTKSQLQPTAERLRELDAGLLVKDIQSDSWALSDEFELITRIDQLAVYRLR